MALLEQADGLIPRLFAKMDVSVDAFKGDLEAAIGKLPRVSGPGAEAGKVYVTQRMNRIMVKAEEESQRLKDEYISVEHLVLAMLDEGGNTPAGKIFSTFNITRQRFLETLTAVRAPAPRLSAIMKIVCIRTPMCVTATEASMTQRPTPTRSSSCESMALRFFQKS